jgi:AcrR family transcriptional regulator
VSVLILRNPMRITTAARAATRRRILEVAHERFAAMGFDAVTTRDIAGAAVIAAGTLFNYFATKEAIAAALVAEALAEAHVGFNARARRGDSLEEELFALVAAELRALRPQRNYLGPVLETALGPLATRRGDAGEAMRRDHLEVVGRLLQADGRPGLIDPGSEHLYWTLYVGVLSFWAHDPSPNQEDTLAVLDQSLRAFVSILPPKAGETGPARSRGAI